MNQQFLEILGATFTAGETKIYQVSGAYFEVLDALYPVNIKLTDRNGAQRGLMSLAEASFFMRNADFETIEINSPNAQTIRFIYGSAEAGTRRSTGLVQVVDGGKARSKTGQSFIGGFYMGATAGQYAALLLQNPAGTGKSLILSQIESSAKALSGMYLASYATNLTNDLSATRIFNKQSGGAAGVGKLWSGANAALLGSAFDYVHIGAYAPRLLRPADPIVLQPNSGVLMQSDTLNIEIAGTFEWYQEDV